MAFLRTGALLGGALLCITGGARSWAQAPAARAAVYRAPKNAEGQPDLQGVWQTRNTASASIEVHSAALGIPGGRGFVVDPADGFAQLDSGEFEDITREELMSRLAQRRAAGSCAGTNSSPL